MNRRIRTFATLAASLVIIAACGVDARAEVLFADNFNRTDSGDINSGSAGNQTDNTGSGIAGSAYVKGFNPANTNISGNRLQLADGPGPSNIYITHNFINSSITDAGGFAIELDVFDVAGGSPAGSFGQAIGIGLSQAEAAGGQDAYNESPRLTNALGFNTTDTVYADFWFGWTDTGLLSYGSGNAARTTINLGEGDVTLRAEFAVSSFANGASVGFELFVDDVSQATGNFLWNGANENYIALDFRDPVEAPADNLSITTLVSSEVPAPAALPAGLALLAGLGLRRRRR